MLKNCLCYGPENVKRGIYKYPENIPGRIPKGKPLDIPDIALPCATQNELNDAKTLVNNGCKAVGEGANMPTTTDAIHHFTHNKILLLPENVQREVAVSGLEMAQNSLRYSWSREEVDKSTSKHYARHVPIVYDLWQRRGIHQLC